MKKLLLLISVCSASVAVAQPTRTTVQNGAALNPLTWDCTCIPALTDNIVINHALSLDVDYYATSGSLTVNASGSITGNIPARFIGVAGSNFTNHGTINIGNLYHSAGSFTNNGSITVNSYFGVDMMAMTMNNGMMNIIDTMGIDTTAEMHNYGTLNVFAMYNAGTFENHMTYNGGDFYNNGTVANMGAGGMEIANLYSNGNFTNTALLNINVTLYNSDNFTNGHQIVVDNDVLNGDTISGTATMTNNGIMSIAGDLLNSETINGTGGKFCVQAQTSNSGAISGTIDICDLTGGAIDLNVGTVGGSVTFCATSCSIGVAEVSKTEVLVYPNPFENYLTIESNNQLLECTLHDMQGRLVAQKVIRNSGNMDVSGLTSGTYVLRMTSTDGTAHHTLVTK